MSAWRAAGVATKIIGNPDTNPMTASPEDYVTQAFSKMTSGVHAGWFAHEILHLIWTNLLDIVPQSVCAGFFGALFRHHRAMDEAKEAAKKKE